MFQLHKVTFEGGVLTVVLKGVVVPPVEILYASPARLIPIDEGRPLTTSLLASATQQRMPPKEMSSSPSLSSLPTEQSQEIEDEGWTLPKITIEAPLMATTGTMTCPPEMVLSAPPCLTRRQCFLQDTKLLQEDGTTLMVQDMKSGCRVYSLGEEDDVLVFHAATVKSCRREGKRDQDVVTVKLEAGDYQLCCTSSHSVLVHHDSRLKPLLMADLLRDTHQLVGLSFDDNKAQATVYMDISKPDRSTKTECFVWEIELDDPLAVMMVEVDPGMYVATFGADNSWMQNAQMGQVNNGRVEVHLPSLPLPCGYMHWSKIVFPHIHTPDCNSWCRFHFSSKEGCKWGPLCSRCHDPSHAASAAAAPTHRGKAR